MKKFMSIFFKMFIVACMFLIVFSTSTVRAAGSHGGGGHHRGGTGVTSSSSSSDTSSSSSSSSSGSSSASEDLEPEDYEPNGEVDGTVVERYSARFFNFLYAIAVIVSVIMVMFVGLKYVTGSVTEKAEYKKNLVPMAIGVLLVAFLVTIIRIIMKTASSI